VISSLTYGLLGRSLSHSFSKKYFEKKFKLEKLFNHSYLNFEIDVISDFPKILKLENLKGLNVTNPYKQAVIPFLTTLSEDAKSIGAVNCISKTNDGKWLGHNTDYYGFSQSIKPFLEPHHNKALILGTGGAAKAVEFALKKIGVEVYFVTTSTQQNANTFFYNELNEYIFKAFKLIINCTPLGLFPKIDVAPSLPYHFFSPQHLAYDLIYNPTETLFLKLAKKNGALTVNGHSMLQLQAEKSWEIWNK
jgi:shikimate dehydrogenase